MVARIYDKNDVSLSTYIDFKDKTLQEVKEWFSDNFKGCLEEIDYIYSLEDNKSYRWGDLAEIIQDKDYGIKDGSPIYDKNTSTFYPCLWQWLQNGSFVMLNKNEDFARYICGPEYRGKVENACIKMIGATIELAVQGKGAWRSAGTMSKEALAAVADMKKQFVKRCASRKYDIKKIAVYEFDQLFVVGPVWWLLSNAETPEEHRTNY